MHKATQGQRPEPACQRTALPRMHDRPTRLNLHADTAPTVLQLLSLQAKANTRAARLAAPAASSTGVIQREFSAPEQRMVETLVKVYADTEIYISNKKLIPKDADAKFAAGKNLKVSDIKDELVTAINKDDGFSKTLMKLLIASDDQATLLKKLEDSHSFEQDKTTAAETLMSSTLLGGKGEAEEDADPEQDLADLSTRNLAGIKKEGATLFETVDKLPDGNRIRKAIGSFSTVLGEKYKDPEIAHASKANIPNQINSTNNRKALDGFAQKSSGRHEAQKGLTNTSATNTNDFSSHDFVYLNVYPKMRDKAERKKLLGGTRFLREDYANAASPVAKDARTYLYNKDAVINDEHVSTVVLRDPVHPSGGMTEPERKRRVENNPYTNYAGANTGGYRFSYGSGEGERQAHEYKTKDHIFAGKDITPALMLNVIRGLLRILVAIDQHARAELLSKIEKATKETDEAQQDKMVLELVKWFQYPQLMVSGSLDTSATSEIVEAM